MANKNVFQTLRGAFVPAATVRNDAGTTAYELSPKATLARLAATGCLTRTFYASAETQLDRVLDLANQVDVDFLAKTALYARRKGFMKDMPALLCAVLATRDLDRLIEVFPEVIDNGKMLRTSCRSSAPASRVASRSGRLQSASSGNGSNAPRNASLSRQPSATIRL